MADPFASSEYGTSAVFIDFDNVTGFNLKRILEFLQERSNLATVRAYANYGNLRTHQNTLVALNISVFPYRSSGKNSADITLAVDATELLFRSPSIETFVLVSGDSDFYHLVKKLREYGKRVVGIGPQDTSETLVAYFHAFLYYEDIVGEAKKPRDRQKAEKELRRALKVIQEDYGSEFNPSLLKDKLQRLNPAFNPKHYGFKGFVDFAQAFPSLLRIDRRESGDVRCLVNEKAVSGRK